MTSSNSSEATRVARYFDSHAVDFDTIYETEKGPVRRLRDRLSRGTVLARVPFVLRVAKEKAPATALDVGCGAGRFSVPLAERGLRVVGLDFAQAMIDLANVYAKEGGVGDRCTFLCEDVMAWEAPASFDLSLVIGVLDYVSAPEPLLRRITSLTSGCVVVSFPRLLHPLVPIRWVRLRLAGCPVFFYTRRQIETLADSISSTYEITKLGRDYMLVAGVAAATPSA